MKRSASAESGSVMYYIFIAIALMAALTYAVTRSTRGGVETLSRDRQNLLATEILDYAHALRNAVSQLRLRNVPFAEISFAHPQANSSYGTFDDQAPGSVYGSQGGAIIYRTAPAEALTTPTAMPYIFTATTAVQYAGTDCTTMHCTDLLMVLPDLKKDICLRLNEMIGVAAQGGEPPTDTGLNYSTLFSGDGTYNYTGTLGDDDEKLRSKAAACFLNDSGPNYVFYQVLLPR